MINLFFWYYFIKYRYIIRIRHLALMTKVLLLNPRRRSRFFYELILYMHILFLAWNTLQYLISYNIATSNDHIWSLHEMRRRFYRNKYVRVVAHSGKKFLFKNLFIKIPNIGI